MQVEINLISPVLLALFGLVVVFIAGALVSGSMELVIFWFEIAFAYVAVETREPIFFGLFMVQVMLVGFGAALYGVSYVLGRETPEVES